MGAGIMKKGQSSLEYMSTYGWAILIVGIAGIVIWQMGLFDLTGRELPGYSGFSVLTPVEWQMLYAPSQCVFDVVFNNGAGETLSDVRMRGVLCGSGVVLPGRMITCTQSIAVGAACIKPATRFEEELAITYVRNSTQESFQSMGKVWGSIA
jgi:hypothetical protein